MSHEADIEKAAADAIGNMMAEQALPGVFVTGRTIVGTASWRDHEGLHITLTFKDGSSMTFVGEFRVDAQAAGPDPDSLPDLDLVEHGKQLMSGDLTDES